MNKENYNPNSVKHNGDWHNEHNSGTWEQHEEKFRNKNVPRHREGWSDESYNQTGEIKYTPIEFNKTSIFWRKLEEIPEDANVPPEMLREAFNGLADKVNGLIDWHNSIEEFEYNKNLRHLAIHKENNSGNV